MMINSCFYIQQDTIPGRGTVKQDTIALKPDSAAIINPLPIKDTVTHKLASVKKTAGFNFADTTTSCKRNCIADITFYDSNNFVTKIESGFSNRFPFAFTEKNREMQFEKKALLIKHLKQGRDIPVQPLHDDWIILIIIAAAFLFSLIRSTSKSVFPGVTRFFLFRGINDPSSREIGGLFHWQSTILNLISFIVFGLFAFCVAIYYDSIPFGISGIIFWLISLGIIVTAVTLRHIVCLITGNASGQREVFAEYLLGVYQFYRFSAIFLFVLIILMSYTALFTTKVFLISGIIVLCIFYLIRITRLMFIFLNRNISIFYLILYLCALEILPVLISVKYFTGLV
jgi:hypothetical protein